MLESIGHVVLTVTRDCNLNCSYCFEKDKHLYRGEKMTLKCFRRFLKRLTQDINKSSLSPRFPIDICFHGGEPTLVDISTLQSFIDATREQFSESQIRFGMQTNGTLLNEQWQEFVQKNNIPLSISLDGADYKSNQFRFINEQDFRKKNPLHKKSAFRGVLTLLTRDNISRLIPYMFYLWGKFQITGIRANIAEFVFEEPECNKELSGEILLKKFYIPFLRLKSFLPFFQEHHVDSVLTKFVISYLYSSEYLPVDNTSHICDVKFCGTGNTIVNLLPDGTVWACQRSLGIPGYRLGNIFDTMPDLFGLGCFNKLIDLALPMAQDIRKKGCDLCFAADICDYGCRAFGLLKTKGKNTIREDLVCDIYKPLKKYLFKNVYNYIVLFALQQNCFIQKDRSFIKIQLPGNYNNSHHLNCLRNQNIQIVQGNGFCGVSIPRAKLNKRSLFWIQMAIWRQKKRSEK